MQNSDPERSRASVAVVGAGVAGIVAAWGLDRRGVSVHLLEAGRSLGGHTNTVLVPHGPDEGTPVDTGFITYNDRTYPQFIAWLAQLGIEGRECDMSFGYQCHTSGLAYGGHSPNTLFAQRQNLVSPSFWRLIWNVLSFNRFARRWIALHPHRRPELGTLREFCRRFAPSLLEHYLGPLGAAIWSAPPDCMGDFPASMYLRFFHNHGLLSWIDRPVWRTVPDGSHTYIRAFLRHFRGVCETATPVESVRRFPDHVEVRTGGEWRRFDSVVLACHADQALRLLEDADPLERELLSPWHYQANDAVLHCDESFLPPLELVRASWNYVRSADSGGRATLTYDMNRLQGLKTRRHYLVTLNPSRAPRPDSVIGSWLYHHPQFTPASLATQARLGELQHRRRSYFCGSYFRFGFHEDAVRAALSLLPFWGGPSDLAGL